MRYSELESRIFVKGRSDAMRKGMTPAEAILWIHIQPLGFKAQVMLELPRLKSPSKIDRYICDFLSADGHLCVEVDGGIHKKKKGHDRRRDTRLAISKIRTLRFGNIRIFRELDAVIREIMDAMQQVRL